MVLTAFAELPGRIRLSLLGVMAAFLTALGACSSNHACAGALAGCRPIPVREALAAKPQSLAFNAFGTSAQQTRLRANPPAGASSRPNRRGAGDIR